MTTTLAALDAFRTARREETESPLTDVFDPAWLALTDDEKEALFAVEPGILTMQANAGDAVALAYRERKAAVRPRLGRPTGTTKADTKEQISVRLPAPMLAELRQVAAATGTSIGAQIEALWMAR